jgi:hypothetical protein
MYRSISRSRFNTRLASKFGTRICRNEERLRIKLAGAGAIFVASAVLLFPAFLTAQRHAASSGSTAGTILARPDGVDDKDSLEDFHRSIAVQATREQMAEFQSLVKTTDAAKARLQAFSQQRSAATSASQPLNGADLDQALDASRAGSKKFVDGFSAEQRNGLKEVSKRLAKADSDLEAEERRLDQSLQVPNAPDVESHTQSLTRVLNDFSSEQLALGKEMGILLASGDDQTFRLPAVKSTENIGGQTIAFTTSGELAQVTAEGGRRTFKLEMVADLTDLQRNITDLLRGQFDKTGSCGEQLTIRQASIAPANVVSSLNVQLHYERWICLRTGGQPTSTLLAESDGSVDMKLTLSVDPSSNLKLTSEVSRVDATGMMGESLRTGDLGSQLRDKVSRSILTALQNGVDLKTALPPAVKDAAAVHEARFHDAGAGILSVVFDGQIELSNDQVNLMASQLNQSLAAPTAASR